MLIICNILSSKYVIWKYWPRYRRISLKSKLSYQVKFTIKNIGFWFDFNCLYLGCKYRFSSNAWVEWYTLFTSVKKKKHCRNVLVLLLNFPEFVWRLKRGSLKPRAHAWGDSYASTKIKSATSHLLATFCCAYIKHIGIKNILIWSITRLLSSVSHSLVTSISFL